MNQSKLLIGFVFLLFFSNVSNAQNHLTKVRIYPATKQERNEIIALLEIDHFMPARESGIEAELSQMELARLKRSNVKYTVLIDNINKWLDSANNAFFSSYNRHGGRIAFEQEGTTIGNIITTPVAFQVKNTFAGYYQFAEMEAAMNTLVATYPSIASKIEIGTTDGGNKLWVIKISDNVGTDEDEPEAFFMGLQHPREAITGASMIFFMQYLCEQYNGNNQIKELVNNREIFIMPCFNPDGYIYNYTSTGGAGGGSWRKNRNRYGGQYGVDLNRNWGVDWGNCNSPILGNQGSCGSGQASAETYYGPNAFSELETQALRTFAKSHHFKVAFDQHAYGPYYSLPFGRQSLHNTASTDMSTKDSNFYQAVPAIMGKYNGMRAADSYDALGYEVAGGFKDWMLTGEIGVGTKDTVWGITGEGAAGGGTSAYGTMSNFWAPASQIVNLCKGMCFQNIQLALAAGSYADIQDMADVPVSSITGNFSLRLQRIGLTDKPFTVSLIPLENISSAGAPVSISGLSYFQVSTASISYSLPATLKDGERIRYAWKVESGGISYTDTVTKVYNPTILFFDDMEGTLDDNWTTYGMAGNSGYGFDYTSGNWQFTQSGGYNSNKALSESAAGTRYGTGVRAYAQCKTAFNLSDATSAYLSFWVRHRAENFRDKVQVQLSKDGILWTAISGKTTVQEPGALDGSTIDGVPALTGVRGSWTQETFNLDAYKGEETVYLRFEFTSDDDLSGFEFQTDDGFYIDNVSVVKGITSMITLPVNFTRFTGNLRPDRTVQLNWQVTNNEKHDYFEIHRSDDGISFLPIGRLDDGEQRDFVDRTPSVGHNYYRIVQADKQGKQVYSKVITVSLQHPVVVSVFPNPGVSKIRIKLSAPGAVNTHLQITDVTGRQFFATDLRPYNSVHELTVDMQQWPSQLYIIKLTGKGQELISTQKIMKY